MVVLVPVPSTPIQCRDCRGRGQKRIPPQSNAAGLATQRRIWGASRQASSLYMADLAALTSWRARHTSGTGQKHGSYARHLLKLKGGTIRAPAPPPFSARPPRAGNKTYAPSLLTFPVGGSCYCGSNRG